MALAKSPCSFQLCQLTKAFNSAHAEYTDLKSEFSKMAKVDQIHPDAKKITIATSAATHVTLLPC